MGAYQEAVETILNTPGSVVRPQRGFDPVTHHEAGTVLVVPQGVVHLTPCPLPVGMRFDSLVSRHQSDQGRVHCQQGAIDSVV